MKPTLTYREFLALAIPFTLSNVTQPLLGAVDTAVVGRLESATAIGGVAIGTVIFNTMYWLFGFLRVSTSGFAARSLGTEEPADQALAWLRPLAIAVPVALVILLCGDLLFKGAMWLYAPEPQVARYAGAYFHILIFGAPLVLIGYINIGWLMGRGLVRQVLILQIGTNVGNMLLDLLFVLVLHYEVAGVAAATLISQLIGFSLGLFFIFRRMPLSMLREHLRSVFEATAMKRMIAVNRDLLIRTACLVTMTNIFIARGSAMGSDLLAANAILFQLQYVLAYLFDGLANTASVFSGKYAGSGQGSAMRRLRTVVDRTMVVEALLLAGILVLVKGPLLTLFTDHQAVLAFCHDFFFYLLLFLIAMPVGLVYSGFYIGTTCSAPIRNAMLVALSGFLAAEFLLVAPYANHGLWTAFIFFCLLRSSVLFLSWKGMLRTGFDGEQRC